MKTIIFKATLVSMLCYGIINPSLAVGQGIHACDTYDQCVEMYCTPDQSNNFYYKSPACIKEDVPLDHRKSYFNTTPNIEACRKEADECLKEYFCMSRPTTEDLATSDIDEGNTEESSGRLRGGGNRSTDKEERLFLFCPNDSVDCEPERVAKICGDFNAALIAILGNLLL